MNNELMRTTDNLETTLTEQTNSFCSFQATDAASKAILFNGMNNPEHRISDEINTVILAEHVFVEMIPIKNEETGEDEIVPRIVIFDTAGESQDRKSVV